MTRENIHNDRAPIDYADDGMPFGDYGDDEPATNTIADQIMGGIILFVVILALIGGAAVIKGLVS